MRRMILSLAAGLFAATISCVAVLDDHHGTRAVVEVGHVCYDSCNHYYVDGSWYIMTGHRHGPGCGHSLVSGKWLHHGGGHGGGHGKHKDKHH